MNSNHRAVRRHTLWNISVWASLIFSATAFSQTPDQQDIMDNTPDVVQHGTPLEISDSPISETDGVPSNSPEQTTNTDINSTELTDTPPSTVESSEQVPPNDSNPPSNEVSQPNINLLEILGFTPDMTADKQTISQIIKFAKDDSLRILLIAYEKILQARDSSNAFSAENLAESIFQPPEPAPEKKIGIYQTLLPYLTQHAMASHDLLTLRRLRESSHSLNRLWPNRHYEITCRTSQDAIRFSLSSLAPSAHLTTVPMDSSEFQTEITSEPECSIVTVSSEADLVTEFEEALHDAIFALQNKDNDLTANAMRRLSTLMTAFQTRDETDSDWNTSQARWLCQLQIISLIALEQNRFPELARLERSIQKTFPGSTFYTRLADFQTCKTSLTGSFAQASVQLNADHSSSYKWIVEQFSSKNIKKIDKSFAAWIKKGSKQVKFNRSLLAAWTAWSLGNYNKAASFAGDVTENRSRIVHPQLHSFDVMLKAVQGTEISQESLETYVRVIRLKSPFLVYQTLTESAPWWNSTMRLRIAQTMSQYEPSHASAEAALFYTAYESELRLGMNAAHKAANDAWLESELRLMESPIQTISRRLVWLDDLVESENWSGIESLSALAVSDTRLENYQQFWQAVSVQANAVRTGEPVEVISLWTEFENCQNKQDISHTPALWLKNASTCLNLNQK